jgi:BirA family biotin operon repressor/biotin-[acetyl-CoA-carboxylase] ligase
VAKDLPLGLPELPSVFEPVVALREGGDAMTRALALAPEHGAGTLAWVRSASRIEAAVVLEPELPLAAARGAIFAGASALADALAAYGPPEVPLTFHWPGIVLVNDGQVGRIRLAWPDATAEQDEPAWLVLGMEARLSFPRGWEPGHGLHQTAILEEGWSEDEVSCAHLTAAWARHLMANLAEWQRVGPGSGFTRMAERYLARLARQEWMGEARRGIDPASGDLLLDEDGTRTRHALLDALAVQA